MGAFVENPLKSPDASYKVPFTRLYLSISIVGAEILASVTRGKGSWENILGKYSEQTKKGEYDYIFIHFSGYTYHFITTRTVQANVPRLELKVKQVPF